MSMGITAATRVLALLGDPVEHSFSPALQNAAFREAGVDAVYVTIPTDDEGLPGLMRGLARAGGGGNVTLPHKQRAAALLDVPGEAVRRTGACNTFWGDEGRLHGDNTDVEGFREAAELLVGGSLEGSRVLVLGAGGAARAVVAALLEAPASGVSLLNRTPARAPATARAFRDPRVRVVDEPGGLDGESFDLVANATPLGLRPGDRLALDLDRLEGVGAVLDLVYGPDETGLVREARARGIPAQDGGEMLVQQGAAAFRRWWGREAPLETMRAALEASRRAR